MKPDQSQFQPKLDQLWKTLAEHIKDEEPDLLRLGSSLSSTEHLELGEAYERTKMFMPTRSHAMAPNRPVSYLRD